MSKRNQCQTLSSTEPCFWAHASTFRPVFQRLAMDIRDGQCIPPLPIQLPFRTKRHIRWNCQEVSVTLQSNTFHLCAHSMNGAVGSWKISFPQHRLHCAGRGEKSTRRRVEDNAQRRRKGLYTEGFVIVRLLGGVASMR